MSDTEKNTTGTVINGIEQCGSPLPPSEAMVFLRAAVVLLEQHGIESASIGDHWMVSRLYTHSRPDMEIEADAE